MSVFKNTIRIILHTAAWGPQVRHQEDSLWRQGRWTFCTGRWNLVSIFSTLASLRNSLNSVLFQRIHGTSLEKSIRALLTLKLIYLKTKEEKQQNKEKRH